ncbi:MAG TPA: hypothetical protein VGR16_13245 [Thermomicrobiales bacterium]|nr:hypothetical protein [Thermomicrobiales bacterium]
MPTKFTPETMQAIFTGVRAGLSYRLAAEAAGIHYDTFNEWQQGRFPRGADRQLKAEFSDQLTRAKGQSAARLTALISNAATDDWRAAAWLLERRFPRDFACRRRPAASDTEGCMSSPSRRIADLETIVGNREPDGPPTWCFFAQERFQVAANYAGRGTISPTRPWRLTLMSSQACPLSIVSSEGMSP